MPADTVLNPLTASYQRHVKGHDDVEAAETTRSSALEITSASAAAAADDDDNDGNQRCSWKCIVDEVT